MSAIRPAAKTTTGMAYRSYTTEDACGIPAALVARSSGVSAGVCSGVSTYAGYRSPRVSRPTSTSRCSHTKGPRSSGYGTACLSAAPEAAAARACGSTSATANARNIAQADAGACLLAGACPRR